MITQFLVIGFWTWVKDKISSVDFLFLLEDCVCMTPFLQ